MDPDLRRCLDDEMRRITNLEIPPQHITLESTWQRISATSNRTPGDSCYDSARLLVEASHRIGVAAIIIQSKVRALADSGIHSLERDDLLVMAFIARSILEHAGISAHLLRIAKVRYEEARKNPEKKKIESTFLSLEKKLN